MKNIGIITSGGDCGGLNAVVKGVAQMANRKGITCYVIPNGYAGLYNLVDFSTFRIDNILYCFNDFPPLSISDIEFVFFRVFIKRKVLCSHVDFEVFALLTIHIFHVFD